MEKWISGERLIQRFEEWAPKKLAYEKDKIGLLVGSLHKNVKRVLVTLDVLENVAEEAAEKHADLIVAHHPLIFHPLKYVRSDEGQGKIVTQCIKHDIAVYAAHTNLDIAEGGVNDMLAAQLGLRHTEILQPTYHEPLYQLVVYVPQSHADTMRQVLGDAGAGAIGNYSHCSFSVPGTGCFLPQSGANPYLGSVGKLEKAGEQRIEVTVPEHLLQSIVTKMIHAHPYEEPVYQAIPIKNKGKAYGLGRIGKLPEAVPFEQYCLLVKEKLGIDGLRAVGPADALIRTVAVSGGDGNSLIPFAKYRGADALISGDIYYHTAHDALLSGLNVIDAGHYIERVMKEGVQQYLTQVIKEEHSDTEVLISESVTNPFRFIV
ncbi:Nif3-like dinuclear metal center hexameric protein [Sporolactobacillus shoreicorticis]|uniref:GTP cyclohydrolase 1 type 2 homolog n=1 Tax=Sporolactobacillus shoreicorticis TaxID=1923877 RepID=A0ABW5S4E8_9BACL|nr:Nif3-like dinuclear metal center hexameric protein [Sporolactobacillus shoreicorticis]MCO7126320.1 Nif3-like dinuclear metal center hexameric protein [Sporolactobacillus shoreicorticis]